jgi:membrane-associated phospholipid phosphatase
VLTIIRNYATYSWCGCLLLGAAQAFGATPSAQGQSGYINMPSAWTEADGAFAVGYSYDSPYGNTWATMTFLPFLQVTGRYVSITGIPPFSSTDPRYGQGYGRYKDKVADVKLRLRDESDILPAISVGATDLLGTELFKGQYVVVSKSFGPARNFEASIGYGNKRPNGLFAGMRWAPFSAPRWAVVAEYDANDYRKDFLAQKSGAARRENGPAVGLEYRWGWLGAQVARHRDHFSATAYLAIPFSEREFIPKFLEPPPFQAKNAPARVSIGQWQQDPARGAAFVNALVGQNFKNVRVEMDGTVLKLTLTNTRISNLGRAVGRAARTALAFAPEGTRAIQVTFTKQEQPVATYEFLDLQRLSDYFTGLVQRDAFLQTVIVRYANPSDRTTADQAGLLEGAQDDGQLGVQVGHEGDIVQLSSEDREANRFKLVPKVSFFFNDPSGALRYELWAAANYDRRLAEGLYLNGDLKIDVRENVSGVKQPSNSLLPHVRTDIAEYKRGGRFKLNRLMLNQYGNPSERVYTRWSAGFYEEMYRGFGGQVLYLPKDSRWAADLSVDALQQRGFKGWFDKRDYQTVTALGALHYRLPYDLTVTARVGRFLARDEGARIEFKRRLPSGIEFGAWYTVTNGKDITMPGTPANPYHDKGIFLSVPLNIMLPADSQTTAGFGLAPWTRDVGQMVASPGDLYDMVEQPRRDLTTYDGLGNFAERIDEQNLPAVNPPVRPVTNPWPAFRWRLEQSVSATPTLPQWAQGAVIAGGALAAGALLDKPVDRFMTRHRGSGALRAWGSAARALPVALVGASGAAVLFGDARMENMGWISLQAVAGAGALSIGTKNLVGRARPTENLGQWSKTADRSNASFPSNHTSVAFAAVTPFAQEYDAPWLYGLAAVGSLGRTANRQHWVSDVAAGGLLGYAVGGWLWKAQRDNTRSQFALTSGAHKLGVAWAGSY